MTVEQIMLVVLAAIQTPMMIAMFALLHRQGGLAARIDSIDARLDRMEGMLTQLVEGFHNMDKRITVLEAQTMPQTASRPLHPAQERPAARG